MPAKVNTTHTVMENRLVVYRRERSSIWQCRFKVGGIWQRASTKQRKLKDAKEVAHELMITAEVRKRDNLPVVTRRFRDVAKLAIKRIEDELNTGHGKVIYKDYVRVTRDYLIPALGNRAITSIDLAALEYLDGHRMQKMGKAPSASTLLTHNSALNRIFDEAVQKGLMTESQRPKLETKGNKAVRRPAFDLKEIKAVFDNFDGWIQSARNDHSRETRQILRDYVHVLSDTGARPGVELLNLKWKQIMYSIAPKIENTGVFDVRDGEAEEIVMHVLNRTVFLTVDGKTGRREIVGRNETVKALVAIAERNYGIKGNVLNPLEKMLLPTNNDYVFRTKVDKLDVSGSFQKMLERYLDEHGLLIDPQTEQKRVFYSFRHTYATMALTYDKVAIHTLAVQMGTSVQMIEKHYSHLKVMEAVEQLRGKESRKQIMETMSLPDLYQSKTKKMKKMTTDLA